MGGAISAIGISPQNDNVRIVGTSTGGIFGTTTGANPLLNLDALGQIPNNFIGRTVVDPNNVNTAYVTLEVFGVNNVWKTTDLNAVNPTWSSTCGLTPTTGAAGMAIVGEVRLLSPGFAVPSVAAEFGAVSLNAVVVAHSGAVPVWAVVQPAAGGSFTSGGYNGTIGVTDRVLTGRQAWTGNGGGFITTTVVLPPASYGQNAQVRWRTAYDTGTNPVGGGMRIDTVSVFTTTRVCCGTPTAAPVNIVGRITTSDGGTAGRRNRKPWRRKNRPGHHRQRW